MEKVVQLVENLPDKILRSAGSLHQVGQSIQVASEFVLYRGTSAAPAGNVFDGRNDESNQFAAELRFRHVLRDSHQHVQITATNSMTEGLTQMV